MRIRSLIVLMMTVFLASACYGPPPTQYVIVTSTLTPEPIVIIVTATPENAATAEITTAPQPTPEATPETATTAEAQAANGVPTPTIAQIQVAEQPFQNGRMFWLEPIGQIWVLVETEDGRGIWTVHEDLFREGDPEFDPAIVPPEGLLQPERGFGRLWRDNEEVREALGWALQPEVGFVSNYEYQPGGEVVDGEYEPGPGYHVVTSSEGDVVRFNEINGTWQLVRPSRQN